LSAIITVGDEILDGFTQDTNAHWLAGRLFALGVPVTGMEVVGDRVEEIAACVRRWLLRSDVTHLLVCGGLGPTPDDRTFEGVALALDRPLVFDVPTGRRLQEIIFRYTAAGRRASARLEASGRKMAMVPADGVPLINSVGMAPGMAYALPGDRHLFVLPGVPRELFAIFSEELEPRYLQSAGRQAAVVELRYRAAPESAFYPVMKEVESAFPDIAVGSYPHPDRRELTIRVRGASRERVRQVVERVRAGVSYPAQEEVVISP
jgi:molybdenum cofactor synthesis domain-containing protein